jgi:hypothetical protein
MKNINKPTSTESGLSCIAAGPAVLVAVLWGLCSGCGHTSAGSGFSNIRPDHAQEASTTITPIALPTDSLPTLISRARELSEAAADSAQRSQTLQKQADEASRQAKAALALGDISKAWPLTKASRNAARAAGEIVRSTQQLAAEVNNIQVAINTRRRSNGTSETVKPTKEKNNAISEIKTLAAIVAGSNEITKRASRSAHEISEGTVKLLESEVTRQNAAAQQEAMLAESKANEAAHKTRISAQQASFAAKEAVAIGNSDAAKYRAKLEDAKKAKADALNAFTQAEQAATSARKAAEHVAVISRTVSSDSDIYSEQKRRKHLDQAVVITSRASASADEYASRSRADLEKAVSAVTDAEAILEPSLTAEQLEISVKNARQSAGQAAQSADHAKSRMAAVKEKLDQARKASQSGDFPQTKTALELARRACQDSRASASASQTHDQSTNREARKVISALRIPEQAEFYKKHQKNKTQEQLIQEVQSAITLSKRSCEDANSFAKQAEHLLDDASRLLDEAAIAGIEKHAADASAAAEKARQLSKRVAEAEKKVERATRKAEDALIEGAFKKAREALEEAKEASNQAQDALDQHRSIAGNISDVSEHIQHIAAGYGTGSAQGRIAELRKTSSESRSVVETLGSEINATKTKIDSRINEVERAFRADRGWENVVAKGRIDPATIPAIPSAPSVVTPSRPEGIIKNDADVKQVEVLGRWRQISKDTGPDFAPGGYSESTLVFRADDVLEVHRVFGDKNKFTLTWRIGLSWEEARSRLRLGAAPLSRPAPESLKGFSIKGQGITVQAATQPFPVVLECRYPSKDRITLGGKVYIRLPDEQ